MDLTRSVCDRPVCPGPYRPGHPFRNCFSFDADQAGYPPAETWIRRSVCVAKSASRNFKIYVRWTRALGPDSTLSPPTILSCLTNACAEPPNRSKDRFESPRAHLRWRYANRVPADVDIDHIGVFLMGIGVNGPRGFVRLMIVMRGMSRRYGSADRPNCFNLVVATPGDSAEFFGGQRSLR